VRVGSHVEPQSRSRARSRALRAPRRGRSARGITPTDLLVLGLASLVLVVVLGAILITDRGLVRLAQDLHAGGTAVAVEDVRLYTGGCARLLERGCPSREIEVRLPDGTESWLRGVEESGDDLPAQVWLTPPEGHRYAAPLAVLQDPGHPDRVMAVVDADRWRSGSVLRQDALALGAVCTLGLVGSAGAWWLTRRRRRDGERLQSFAPPTRARRRMRRSTRMISRPSA